MKATETYGFPYPECDPPLVKDASQVAQVRQLAEAFDEEVQRIVDAADDTIIHPPAARLNLSVLPVATTDSQATPFFDVLVFESNWPSALDLAAGGLRVELPGWYLVGCHALVSSATAAVLPMVRLTVNGAAASSWSAVGGNYGVGNGRLAPLSGVPLNVNEGDIIRMEIKHLATGSPTWDYRPHLWAVRLVSDS
ncbi:hypothetical protein [Streptomyces sp. NPDC058664]|uniref:hypothetical protein n=1 Tax=unclassified Streptomyces TaxID=2593676 RepID=UPI0036502287